MRLALPLTLAAALAACGRSTPTEPSARAVVVATASPAAGGGATSSAGAAVQAASPGRAGGPSPLALPEGLPTAVAFPPRNEALDFRRALEVKYRDGLRRGATTSFVDLEGTIVWTQEYLRYRVNQCDHATAVQRVLRQIDGLGDQPVCSDSEAVVFPPRQEPFDFRVQLESKYRDGLRRQPVETFVDVEGDIVWTQEYLRYRVSGCAHGGAQDRVFMQIDGRGVQPDCGLTPPPGGGGGGGGGGAGVVSGTVAPNGLNLHELGAMTANGVLTARLTWDDTSVDLDLYLTDGACNAYPPTGCTLLAASRDTSTNREQISRSVRRGETLRLWVDNFDRTRGQGYRLETVLGVAGLVTSDGGAAPQPSPAMVWSPPRTRRKPSRRGRQGAGGRWRRTR